MGHIERLPPAGPSARHVIRKETSSGAHGKGRNAAKPDKAADRVLVHGPNALRLPPNITQSSGTLPVIPMLDRGEGGTDKTAQASCRFVQRRWHDPLAVKA